MNIEEIRNLLDFCSKNSNDGNINRLGYYLSEYCREKLKDEDSRTESLLSLNYLLCKDYNLSFDYSVKCMRNTSLTENECNIMRDIQLNCIENIYDRYSQYDTDRVCLLIKTLIQNKLDRKNNGVTITMTSCKRFDLFYKTVCSFINCCLDIDKIDEWLVVDDCSSQEDRLKMIEYFPFIKFIFKEEDERGHSKSMNIIKNYVTTPYIFHIEDDWIFFVKDNYISKCIEVLECDSSYGQCLLNRNYGERAKCVDIYGGEMKYTSRYRYYVHQFYEGEELKTFINNSGGKNTCSYWPHYSLRVGMTKREVFEKVGNFDDNASHFEMDYAYRYTKSGFKTTFLDSVYCYHSGRCTFERGSGIKNAYDLNDVVQFGEKNTNLNTSKEEVKELSLSEEEKKIEPYYKKESRKYNLKTYVLNLERRSDRKKEFILNNHDSIEKLQYSFFNATDGREIKLTPKVLKVFENGDFNYRRGIVGCAISHIRMWNDLIDSDIDTMLILEDDVLLTPNFIHKLSYLLNLISDEDWDIVFLGHFLYENYRSEKDREDKLPKATKWSREECIEKSMGGTIGYVITKNGALKMLKTIADDGVYNAIDWVMFKAADRLNIYYSYPHLVFSECATKTIKPDSDIQYDNTSLMKKNRLNSEIEYWMNKLSQKGIKYDKNIDCLDFVKDSNSRIMYTETIPSRDEMLSYVCVVKDTFRNVVNEVKKIKDSIPIEYYSFLQYVIIVPYSKIDKDVLDDVFFDV